MLEQLSMRLPSYIRHCIRFSLLKRWWWPVVAAVTVGLAQAIFGVSPVRALLLSLLAATITLLGIAFNSYARHQHDF